AIQERLDFLWRGQFLAHGSPCRVLGLFTDDVVAQADALVADEDGRPGDQLVDFVLAFVAEGTMQRLVLAGTLFFGHGNPITWLRRCAKPVPCRSVRIPAHRRRT